MSRTPFLILNFFDFDVYVVMTPIFPANQRRCASSSKNVAILSLWSKQAIIAPNNLIDSHHYKRHKKIRMTAEFHSPSLSILIITQSKVSFLIILNYSKMISCMNKTKQIIDNHNKRILTASIQIDDTATAAAATIDNNKTCNCRQKNTCPLDGNCLQSSVIYQATVTRKDNNTTETYIGLTENDFKTRYRNHTASFRHAKHRNSTELSKHIWTLKDNNIEHFICWRILSSHSPYNSSSKRCNLFLKEKFLIICRPELSTLNKRNELVSSCRHRNKALLRNN